MNESTVMVVSHMQNIINIKNTELLELEPTFMATSGGCFGSKVKELNYEIIGLKHLLDNFKIVMKYD